MPNIDDNRSDGRSNGRILLLLTARTYRAASFLEAAERLGIEVVKAIDMHNQLAEYWRYPLGINYSDVEGSVAAIVRYASNKPFDGIVAVDDSGSVIAAWASQALGLPHNSPEAAEAARNKYRMRQLLSEGGIPVPWFRRHLLGQMQDHGLLADVASSIPYPCVVKPVDLSGSRGVIRVDNPDQFLEAVRRLQRILGSSQGERGPQPFLVEQFVPGVEVALEGMLHDGHLNVLAIFDKPDPLDGPYFEETIYLTPSRLPVEVQKSIVDCADRAAAALGLREGPLHAELRFNQEGPWLIEAAGRSIGGLCSNTLQFGTDTSLEELILRQTVGMEVEHLQRESEARGVMMIPIPEAGLLKAVEGCEAAAAVPLIQSIDITAKLNHTLTPLPEGDSYLGFIFARGGSPAEVEKALRTAHSKLRFRIAPLLAVLPVPDTTVGNAIRQI